MKFFLFCLLALVFVSLSAEANEAVRATQARLSKLGFYNGKVDGDMGSQTSAAIRRYQIAENLKVTGELNRQTQARLGLAPSIATAPAYVAIADIYRGGPYISVGPEMQIAVLKQAQKNLRLLGYYNGPQDGMPNASLVTALRQWQRSAGFRQTGRLDENSLKGLDLLSN